MINGQIEVYWTSTFNFHNSVNMFNMGYRLCSAFAALPTAGPAKMNYRYDQCDNKYNIVSANNKQWPSHLIIP